MTTLSDLIARLEAAKEGSRELDCLIAPLAGWKRITPSVAKRAGLSCKSAGGWIAPEDIRNGEVMLDSLHGTTIYRDPPMFTRSLDAALTLVPDGWMYQLLKTSGVLMASGKPNNASIKAPSEHGWVDPPRPHDGYADTMALALCIAALKAREAAR